MIVEVESHYGDVLLSGKVSSIGQPKYRMMQTLRDVGQIDFASVFCERYNFEVIPYAKNLEWDYRIDLDVCKVFIPMHKVD